MSEHFKTQIYYKKVQVTDFSKPSSLFLCEPRKFEDGKCT